MNARTKLNSSYIQGGIVAAAIIGWLTGSWVIFFLAAAVLIALSLHSGDIRPGPGKR